MAPTLMHVTQCAPYSTGPSGVHRVLPQSNAAMAEIAELCGLDFVAVDDVRAVDEKQIANCRLLSLFTIGDTPWSAAQRQAIFERVRAGECSVVAIHSATDSAESWDEYATLVGARFNGHPWTMSFTAEVTDPRHPAVAHLGHEWPWHDEVYQVRELRPDAQILLRVPAEQLDLAAKGVVHLDHEFPLAWAFTEGEGRVFSTSLGHFPEAWESIAFLGHLLGGTRWALDVEPSLPG